MTRPSPIDEAPRDGSYDVILAEAVRQVIGMDVDITVGTPEGGA